MDKVYSITPLRDRLLVKFLHPVETDKKRIIIPDAFQTGTMFATVVAVGPKIKDVKPGDVVCCPGVGLKPGFADWFFDDLLMIQQADIAGIVEGLEA